MKKSALITNTLIGALALATANANVVPGYSQRYEAATLSGTKLENGDIFIDSVDRGADGKVVGSFDLTQTTPNGSQVIANTGAGQEIKFRRATAISGSFTIQMVIRVDLGNTDGRQAPIGFDETGPYGGIFAGINAADTVDDVPISSILRAGNLGNTGANGPLEGEDVTVFAGGTWGIYTIVVDPTAEKQLIATFDLLSNGANVFTITKAMPNKSSDVGVISVNGRLFGGETSRRDAKRTDEFRGAIADMIIYDFALNSDDLAKNKAAFTSLFYTTP